MLNNEWVTTQFWSKMYIFKRKMQDRKLLKAEVFAARVCIFTKLFFDDAVTRCGIIGVVLGNGTRAEIMFIMKDVCESCSHFCQMRFLYMKKTCSPDGRIRMRQSHLVHFQWEKCRKRQNAVSVVAWRQWQNKGENIHTVWEILCLT